MDLELLKMLNGVSAANDGFEDAITAYVGLSVPLFAGLLVLLFVLVPRRGRRESSRHGALAAAVSAAVALGAAQVLAVLVDRPRPYVAHPEAVHLFVARSADPSFPSDHATAAFAIAFALLLRSRRLGSLALLMASLLALGRVAVGAHYPSDVLGGALLGGAAALLLWVPAIRRALDRTSDHVSHLWDAVVRRALALARAG